MKFPHHTNLTIKYYLLLATGHRENKRFQLLFKSSSSKHTFAVSAITDEATCTSACVRPRNVCAGGRLMTTVCTTVSTFIYICGMKHVKQRVMFWEHGQKGGQYRHDQCRYPTHMIREPSSPVPSLEWRPLFLRANGKI